MKGELTIGKVSSHLSLFCFQSSSIVGFNVKVKVRSKHLSVRNNIYFKLIWIDEMQIITESRIVE